MLTGARYDSAHFGRKDDKSGKRNFFLCLTALAALLNVPGLINGQPFLFSDTATYLRGADAAAYRLTGHKTGWSSALPDYARPQGESAAVTAAARRGAAQPDNGGAATQPKVVLSGRSIYYGAWLYLSQLLGSFWPLAIVQSLLAAAAMLVTAQTLARKAPDKSPLLFTGLVGTGLLTGAGFFVDMMMPDIFAALGILATGHLALTWREDDMIRRVFWLSILICAALFHSANLLISGGMLVLMAAARLGQLPAWRDMALLPAAAALLVGVGGDIAFGQAVRHATGYPPVRPPFLTARLVEDGPGTAYLRTHCDRPRFLLCAHRAKLPLPSDTFLWYNDPSRGVFSVLSPADQRRLAAEQGAFVVAVIRDDPLAVVSSTLRAVLRQLGHGELEIFNYPAFDREAAARKLPPPVFAEFKQSRAYSNTMPTGLVDGLAPWLTGISIIVIIGLTLTSSAQDCASQRRARALAITIAAGVLINGLVCGGLSTPHGRYQSRVLWLLPLTALALTYGARGRGHAVFPATSP